MVIFSETNLKQTLNSLDFSDLCLSCPLTVEKKAVLMISYCEEMACLLIVLTLKR